MQLCSYIKEFSMVCKMSQELHICMLYLFLYLEHVHISKTQEETVQYNWQLQD